MRYLCLLLGFVYAAAGFADDHSTELQSKIEAALAADIRTAEERERDSNRKPLETLSFFGLKDNMTVVELIPGGGWYSKILAPVLAENGAYHMALGADRVAAKLPEWGLDDKAEVAAVEAEVTPTSQRGVYKIEQPIDLSIRDADMVLTFRNVHNFDAQSRGHINDAAFAALKSGGIYGVVDHTRRHMESDTAENWRRVDPVLMIQEAIEAGFEFVGYSDLHYRPDDELRYDTRRKSLYQNSDRFTLKFKKP